MTMTSKTRQLRKIAIDEAGNVHIVIEERVIIAPPEGEEESKEKILRYTVQGDYAPHNDLKDALLKCRKYALDLHEFPDDTKYRSSISVLAINISGDMDLQNSRVIFELGKYVKRAEKVVKIGKTHQNTMYGTEYEKEKEMTKAIEAVVAEVWEYLDGKNGENVQLSLQFEGETA